MGLLVPEAGARYRSCIVFSKDVIRLWLWFHGQALVIRLQPGGDKQ